MPSPDNLSVKTVRLQDGSIRQTAQKNFEKIALFPRFLWLKNRYKNKLSVKEFQKDKPRTQRMTRHFYDMYKLAHTPFVDEALQDVALYHRIVEHRETYYHVHYVAIVACYRRISPSAGSVIAGL